MDSDTTMMQDTAREIILDCLVGALQAHNPHWSIIHDGPADDPVIETIYAAIVHVWRAYPEPTDPIMAATFANFFGGKTSRQSNDEIRDGRIYNGYDYRLQVWVCDGIIQDVGMGRDRAGQSIYDQPDAEIR